MNALTKQEQQPTQSPLAKFRVDLAANGKLYAAMLKADEQESARFMAEVFQAIAANPKLLDADRSTLLMAIGEAASMGLSVNPNLGEAYLIPRNRSFKDKAGNWHKVLEVNFQPGYKGLVKLAYRSTLIDTIYTEVVYRGEHYLRTGGTDPKIEHIPDDTDGLRTGSPEDIVCAYAVVWIKGSTRPVFRAVPKSDLIRSAQSSGDARNTDPSDVWKNHAEAMCRKTAVLRIAPMLPRDDKLRSFHEASEREGMIEGGKAVPVRPEFAQIRASAPEPDGLEAMMAVPRQPAHDETQVDDGE